ncbi:MAG: hypothetical protein K8S23_04450 [Candidatus Cloacimonetes bacterium]|nr:hypothetical protein [Candidatus Cloacimonadota bacterium]
MRTFEKAFQAETKENLTVIYHSENIGIRIFGEKDTEHSELKMKFRIKEDVENIEEFLKINFDEAKNVLNIDFADFEDEFEIRRAEVSLQVPYKTKVLGQSENGSFSIQNLSGKQNIETENGAIKLTDIIGNIQIKTENGAVILDNIEGDETIQAENGSIKLKRNMGKIKVRTENSSIKIFECGNELDLEFDNGTARVLKSLFEKATIKNENGGIYYEFTQIEQGDFKFENENGKIQLVVPEGIPYDITAKNLYGSFHVGLKGNYEKFKEDGQHCIHLVHDSGNVKIHAENENGSIRLVENLQKNHSYSYNFDFNGFSDKMDNILDKIPDEAKKIKVKKKLKKLENKLGNFNFHANIPDFGHIIEEAMEGVPEEIENQLKNIDFSKFGKKQSKKLRKKIHIVTDKIQDSLENQKLNDEEREVVDERSRKKIFELLEQGKINADEAERLIRAMEGSYE